MLLRLAIRDIVLIDRLDLDFGPGLAVLTGETGAGKSILLDAFSLALGARGEGSLVRHGEAQGEVTAAFDPPADHPARAIAAGCGVAPDEGLVLRRVQLADGRTRAFVNDEPVSVGVLRAIGTALVEIHGQHDDRALVDPASHRILLDAFGGLESEARTLAKASVRLQTARADLLRERAVVAGARQEAEFLRQAAAELDRLEARPGEEAELAQRRQTMMQAEKVLGELQEAYDVVAGQGAPTPLIAAVLRRLDRRATQAPALTVPVVEALDAVLLALDEARATTERALAEAAFDAKDLERAEERLFGLRAASRKFNVPADGLVGLRERFTADLAAFDGGEDRLAALDKAAAGADAAYVALARALGEQRRRSAAALDAAVTAELPPLKLERARFLTDIVSDESARGPEGFERVAFFVKTNPGTRPGPLMKLASGGELARFMLALKVALADRGSAPTLVFDEIDTGVGGAVADAIGQRLAKLATRVQVIAVTHAPQVAARAGSHYLIAKEAAAETVATRALSLAPDTRREEIARMLAGATITNEARAAAARLLEGALRT